jgi:hypothetical protein
MVRSNARLKSMICGTGGRGAEGGGGPNLYLQIETWLRGPVPTYGVSQTQQMINFNQK